MRKVNLNRATGVGLLVAVTLAAFILALTFFRKGGFTSKDSYAVHAYFTDATGLAWKSKAQIAGIQVGEVSAIELEGTRARLEIRIKNEVDIRADACLTKTLPSALLPDAILQVFPGSPDRPSLRSLPEGEREITCVRQSASLQQLMDSMARIATDIQKLTGDLASTVGGERGSMREIIENLSRITRQVEGVVSDNAGSLTRILKNAEGFTADLRDVTRSEKERFKAISVNVEELTGQLKRVAASVERLLEGEPGGGGPGAPGEPGEPGKPRTPEQLAKAEGIRRTVERLNDTIAKLDEIVTTVKEGKSTVGKLLVDEKLGRQVGEAVSGGADYIDKLLKLQIEMNMRAEWLFNQSAAKTYFGVRLLPRPDKYYIVDVVSDPRGVDTVKTETVTGTTSSSTTTTTHQDKLTFSLQIAKRYGPMAFRVGIIESSGGLGVDTHLFDDTLTLSVSAYQFTRPQVGALPRAKVWANYHFAKYFYATVGTDDFLNAWNTGRYPGGPSFAWGNDIFAGAGLSFTDDDLKLLLGTGVSGAVPAK